MKQRRSTRRKATTPVGVAERLPDAPPSGYVHGQTGAARPEPYHTYETEGVVHRFDGKCHAACINVR